MTGQRIPWANRPQRDASATGPSWGYARRRPPPTAETREATGAVRWLIAGIAPIRLADRLGWRSADSCTPALAQPPCEPGLFDRNARTRRDLFTKLPPGRPDG